MRLWGLRRRGLLLVTLGYAWFKSSIPYWFGVHGIAVVSMWRRMLRRHNDEPMAFLRRVLRTFVSNCDQIREGYIKSIRLN